MWLLSVTVLRALALWFVGGSYALHNPYCGGRQTMVHLFEWRWPDVARECERFLAPAGYCAVQVSPPMEHVVAQKEQQPWWQRYQPVSYKLVSRSGTEEEFVDMVHRCNAVGVRVIVDAVINHMAALGRTGSGSGGSAFDADEREFPAVPYTAGDFTPSRLCPSKSGNIENYQNVKEVRNCYLLGLTDLYGASRHVRKTVAGYLNHLIDIGVMGFRVDAAKHMWPKDLKAIQGLTKDLNTEQGFPARTRPYFFFEVIDQGREPITVDQYFDLGLTTEFRFCERLAQGIWYFDLLKDVYDPDVGMAPPNKAVVFVDNHDNQRGHGGKAEVLTHKNVKDYTLGSAFMLAQPYGTPRVMSSYYFDNNNQGPPHNANMSTAEVPINKDGSCGGGWVCEHRWNAIAQMVKFRNMVAGTSICHWHREGQCVAFARGKIGFFAMCRIGTLDAVLQTGLPGGSYCDLVSHCARQVTVNADGTARITVSSSSKEPILALSTACDKEDHNPDIDTNTEDTKARDDAKTTSQESAPPSRSGKRKRKGKEESESAPPTKITKTKSSATQDQVSVTQNSSSSYSADVCRSNDEQTPKNLPRASDTLSYAGLELDVMFPFQLQSSTQMYSLYHEMVLWFAKMIFTALMVRTYLKWKTPGNLQEGKRVYPQISTFRKI